MLLDFSKDRELVNKGMRSPTAKKSHDPALLLYI